MAYVKYVKGELEEAQHIQEELIAIESRVLGPDHPRTLITTNNLAETLFEQGDVEEALRLHTHVLDSRRRVLGDDHDDVRASQAKIAKARAHVSGATLNKWPVPNKINPVYELLPPLNRRRG